MPARTASSSSSSCANTATRSQILGGFTPVDESLLQQMGDDALGAITGNWYSARARLSRSTSGSSRRSRRDYKVDPGVYAAETYLCGEVLEHAVKQINGKVEDKEAFMKALQRRQGAGHRCAARALRRIRQRGRQQLHPQGREEGRQVRQRGGQDLSGRQPVLDLQAGRVPEEPGLFARLSRRRRIWSSDRTLTSPPRRSHEGFGLANAQPLPAWGGERTAFAAHARPNKHRSGERRNYRCSGSSGSSRR